MTDTVGSLNLNSNPNLQNKNENYVPNQSLFYKQRTDSIDQNMIMHSNSPKSSPSKNTESNNLHKLAIKNNMNRGYQDESKNDYSPQNSPSKK